MIRTRLKFLALGLAAVAVSVGVGLALLSAGPFSQTGRLSDLQVRVESGREYAVGDPVEIAVTLRNDGAAPLELRYATSCPGHFLVYGVGLGSHLYDSRDAMLCLPALSVLTLKAGETLRSEATWPQKNASGLQVPVPNVYVVRVKLDFAEGAVEALSDDIEVGFEVAPVAQHFKLALETDKDTYGPGETVQLAVSLTNLAKWPLMVTFANSCQWSFQVEDMGGDVVTYRMYDVRYGSPARCLSAIWYVVVEPGGSYEGRGEWNQGDDTGERLPAPANYVIRASVGPREGLVSIALTQAT